MVARNKFTTSSNNSRSVRLEDMEQLGLLMNFRKSDLEPFQASFLMNAARQSDVCLVDRWFMLELGDGFPCETENSADHLEFLHCSGAHVMVTQTVPQ